MKSSVENLSNTRVKLTVEVPFDEMSEQLTAAYRRIGSQVNIPGFRKGKVPSTVIDQRIGRGAVLEDAVNEVVPAAYEDAVREAGITPVGQPTVEVTEVKDGEVLTFTAEVDIRPDFDLPVYEGIEVSVDDAVVTEEKIDEQLEALQKRFGTAIPVDRPAADADVVLIDVVGTLDGERVEDFCATALSYEVGSNGMVNGADEALRGLANGESATFAFTPDDGEYNDNELEITVTIQDVRERSLPEADDEFAQLASEFDTLAELRENLRGSVEQLGLVEQGMAAREQVLERLLELVDIDVPQSLVDEQLGEHFDDGHGDDEHREEVRTNAARAIKTQFILDKIADKEELSVGQAELSQWLMGQAQQYGMTPDEFADALVKAGQVQMAVADVRRGKALALVLQKSVITDASGNAVNLAALDQPSQEDQIAQLIAQAQAAAAADADEAEVLEEILEEAIEEEIIDEILEEAIDEVIIEEAIDQAAAKTTD